MNVLFNKLAKTPEIAGRLTGTLSGKLLGKLVVNFEAGANALQNLANGNAPEFLKSTLEATATALKVGATRMSRPFALDAAELKQEALEQKAAAASLKTAFMSAGQKTFNKEITKPRRKSAPSMVPS